MGVTVSQSSRRLSKVAVVQEFLRASSEKGKVQAQFLDGAVSEVFFFKTMGRSVMTAQRDGAVAANGDTLRLYLRLCCTRPSHHTNGQCLGRPLPLVQHTVVETSSLPLEILLHRMKNVNM